MPKAKKKAPKKSAKKTAAKKKTVMKKKTATKKPVAKKKAPARKKKAPATIAARPSKSTLTGRSSKPAPEIRLAITPPVRSSLSPRPQPGQLAMPASFSLEHPIEPVHRRPTLSFDRALPPHDLEE